MAISLEDLTTTDKAFLQKMSQQGVPFQEAVSRMQKAKFEFQSPMTAKVLAAAAPSIPGAIEAEKVKQAVSEVSPTTGAVVGQVQKAVPGAKKIRTETAIKEALMEKSGVDLVKDIPIALGEEFAKTGVNVAEVTSKLPKILRLGLPEVSKEEFEASRAEVEAVAEQIRSLTGAEKSVVSEALGKIGALAFPGLGGAKAGSALLKGLGPVGSFIGASLGATTGVELAGEAELPTIGEAGVGLAFDVATLGVGKMFKKIKPNLLTDATVVPKVITNAEKAGIDPDTVKLLRINSPADEKLAQDLFDVALKRVKEGPLGPTGKITPRPLDVVVENLDTFNTGLKTNIDDVGKQIGAAVQDVTETQKVVDLSKAKGALLDAFDSANVKVTPEGLDFTASKFKRSTTDQKFLESIYDFVKTGEAPVLDAVQEYRSIGDALFEGKLKQELTASNLLASKMRKLIQEPVVDLSGNLGKLNKKYSDLVDLELKIKKVFGPNVTESPTVFRRIFSNAASGKKIATILDDIDAAAKALDIKEGELLAKQAGLAIGMEDAIKIQAPTGLAQTFKDVPKKGAVVTALHAIVEKLTGSPTRIEAVQALLDAPVGTKEEVAKAILPELGEVAPDIAIALRAILIGDEEE